MAKNFKGTEFAAKGAQHRPAYRKIMVVSALCAACATTPVDAAEKAGSTGETTIILTGDARFNTPEFEDYQAVYSSSFAKTGGFTLQARKTGDGAKLSMIDIIPMKDSVIVAQRQIDLKTHRSDFSAQPFFAWGKEYVVGQSDGERYDWTRVPIGGGDAVRMSGDLENGGYINEMFSPTLASLMPMPVGAKFLLPEAAPIAGGSVEARLSEFEVIAEEALNLPSGYSCECWVIERRAGGIKERIWVSREAPFVYRRIRNFGSNREFSSDLLSYEPLEY